MMCPDATCVDPADDGGRCSAFSGNLAPVLIAPGATVERVASRSRRRLPLSEAQTLASMVRQ